MTKTKTKYTDISVNKWEGLGVPLDLSSRQFISCLVAFRCCTLKIADLQAHDASQRCELVDRLFSGRSTLVKAGIKTPSKPAKI